MKKETQTKAAVEPTTRDVLIQGFAKHRKQLEKGDQRLIADACNEDLRTVREYISGLKVTSTDTGLKIFKAMSQLLIKRKQEVEKLVA